MEYVGHQMKNIDTTVGIEDQPYNGFKNIYHAMCVKQDFTSDDDVHFPQTQNLEVV